MEFKEFAEKLQNVSKWVLEERKNGMDRVRMELLPVDESFSMKFTSYNRMGDGKFYAFDIDDLDLITDLLDIRKRIKKVENDSVSLITMFAAKYPESDVHLVALRELLSKFSIDGELAEKIVAGLVAHDEAATTAALNEAEKKIFPNGMSGDIDPAVIANFIGKAG